MGIVPTPNTTRGEATPRSVRVALVTLVALVVALGSALAWSLSSTRTVAPSAPSSGAVPPVLESALISAVFEDATGSAQPSSYAVTWAFPGGLAVEFVFETWNWTPSYTNTSLASYFGTGVSGACSPSPFFVSSEPQPIGLGVESGATSVWTWVDTVTFGLSNPSATGTYPLCVALQGG
jgi:hypothetical protein